RHTRLVSDWSSDVCSSDLAGHGGEFSFRMKQPVECSGRKQDGQIELLTEDLRGQIKLGNVHEGARVKANAFPVFAVGAQSDLVEIGRASCRERVEISGGGV